MSRMLSIPEGAKLIAEILAYFCYSPGGEALHEDRGGQL